MIGKIKKGSGFKGCVNYVLGKEQAVFLSVRWELVAFIVPTGSKQSMLLSMYRCLAGITNTPVMKLFYVKEPILLSGSVGIFTKITFKKNDTVIPTDIRLPPGDMKTRGT